MKKLMQSTTHNAARVLLHLRLVAIMYIDQEQRLPVLSQDVAIICKYKRQPWRVAQLIQDRFGDVAQAGPSLDAGSHRHGESGRPLRPPYHVRCMCGLYLTRVLLHARLVPIMYINHDQKQRLYVLYHL